jgi:hypothetical protein
MLHFECLTHYLCYQVWWGGKTALSRDYANRQGTHYDDWTGLVDGTNTENLCGGNNWRVPTAEELD